MVLSNKLKSGCFLTNKLGCKLCLQPHYTNIILLCFMEEFDFISFTVINLVLLDT